MLETLLEKVSWTFEYVTVLEHRNEFEIGGGLGHEGWG